MCQNELKAVEILQNIFPTVTHVASFIPILKNLIGGWKINVIKEDIRRSYIRPKTFTSNQMDFVSPRCFGDLCRRLGAEYQVSMTKGLCTACAIALTRFAPAPRGAKGHAIRHHH